MRNIFKECDVIFLSYDEPNKEKRYQGLKERLPHIKRVDGIKGLDQAHRHCGEVSSHDRVVIIDGDNTPLKTKMIIDENLFKSSFIISFVSKNSVNGLIYGNGGVKCWPRELLRKCRSHELKESGRGLDFVFEERYYQRREILSVTEIHHERWQAYRAGFREAIKMSLVNGKVIPKEMVREKDLDTFLPETSLYRLRTWLQVGRDIENGNYAMLGARHALRFLIFEGQDPEVINDYDWLLKQSEKSCSYESITIEEELRRLGKELSGLFKEPLTEYSAQASELYKSAMVVALEEGPIQKAREFF